jgi:hypothetical protein
MLKRLRGLLIVPFLAVAIASSEKFYSQARKFVMGGDSTVRSLQNWWGVVTLFSVFMFAITATLVVLFLRVSRRRADRVLMIVCVENALVIWLLFALAAITSDPVTAAALASTGLARLGGWLFNLGLVWCLFLLYLIFQAMDAHASA